ncbi:MAG: acetyl-CoA C-acyltransferase [Negativicutes bacterium]
MENCVITSAARTAVGTFLGSLKTVKPQDLASHVIAEVVKRSQLEKNQIDEVILGHVQSNAECSNIGRAAALQAGLPESVPGYTIDRQCAASLQAVVSATQQIQTGYADIIVAGGVESMSRILFYMPPAVRFDPLRLGNVTLVDAFVRGAQTSAPEEMYPKLNMGITAENVAARHNISREEQDEYAYNSHRKAIEAINAGKFADEIVPFEVQSRKGNVVFDTDEHPRVTTVEQLAKLKPAFKKDGSVTPGNASGMNDAASAVVIMSETRCKQLGLKPMARVVAHAATGLDPRVMGLGPVSAVQAVLKRTGLKLDEIDLFEFNEAFAAQSLGVLRELNMMPGTSLYERLNVNGGGIALGHPLGATGTRLINTLVYELQRRGGRYGIASLCIGGGQGMAVLVEAVK